MNNLTTTTSGYALDARQGNELQNQINTINENFNVLSTHLDEPVSAVPDTSNNSNIWYRTTPIIRLGRTVFVNIVFTNLTINELKVYATGLPHPVLPNQTEEYFIIFPVFNVNTGEICGYGKLNYMGQISIYSTIQNYVGCNFSYAWYY